MCAAVAEYYVWEDQIRHVTSYVICGDFLSPRPGCHNKLQMTVG